MLRTLQRQPGTDSVAVVDGARVGLVVRSRLLMQLGRRFGYSLYEHRPARLLMEEGSTVDAGADPIEVIALAAQREPERLDDDILVLREGRYAGTMSMRSPAPPPQGPAAGERRRGRRAGAVAADERAAGAPGQQLA